MNKTEIVGQPLGLAELYVNGEGRVWSTLAEASAVLSRTEPKVSRAQLKNAKDILSFPPEILSLFEGSGINTFTIRKLVRARSTFGIDELLRRAASLSPARDEDGRRAILKELNCETRNLSLVPAAALVAEYEAGKAANRWENAHQASKLLGLNSRLYKAISIMSLPKMVLDLFSIESMTLSVGLKLEKLVAMHGPDEILRRACWKHDPTDNLTNAQKLNLLQKNTSIRVKARRTASKVVVEFHCPDKDGYLAANVDALLNVLNIALRTIAVRQR